jgi:hypothetical protein
MLIFPVMCRFVPSSPQMLEAHHQSNWREKSVRVCLQFAQKPHIVLRKLRRKGTETQTVFRVDSNFIMELR